MLTQQQVYDLRQDFPALNLKIGEKPLIYLDNAATTQKPLAVIEAVSNHYLAGSANPHRGAHFLANRVTEQYDNARKIVAKFIRARRISEIVFTRNATESLNLLARTLAEAFLKPGDEILISILEHHANIVPWQWVAEQTGAKLRYLYTDENKQLKEEDLRSSLTERTRILSLTAASNVTGTRPDLAKFFTLAKEKNIICIADLAQAVPHAEINVRELKCDFAVFSAHKMYADMGLGVLWGDYEQLAALPPFIYGGDMIEKVTEQTATFLSPATRFEAGTMNVGGALSLQTAIAYLQNIGMAEIDTYEEYLCEYALEQLSEKAYLDVYAVQKTERSMKRCPVLPFNVKDVHPHDVATILNSEGIAVRSGHHCAEPLHHYLGLNATCRASFSFYNTIEEVDKFVKALDKVRPTMGLAL